MAVSKRLRYEVLRRDSHTCRYCGASAPEVRLTVDHVLPVALGGTDEPKNLVTACAGCNAGKSASTPDAALVADVENKALLWTQAIEQASGESLSASRDREHIHEMFRDHWTRRLPMGWKSTVDALVGSGLDPQVIFDMAGVALTKKGVEDRWKYFCGCCWNRVKELQDRALELANRPDAQFDAQAYAPSNAPSICSEHCSMDMLNAADVMDLWSSVNERHQRRYGFDLKVCNCDSDCNSARCRLEIALYMSGWMDQEEVTLGVQNIAEVTHGAALDTP